MIDTKNIILAFGNKEFNNSLIEIKDSLNFNLEIIDNIQDDNILERYQGLIIHQDALTDKKLKKIINNEKINKIIFHYSKNFKNIDNVEKLELPASVEHINKIVVNNIVRKKFRVNSSLKINNYVLDKNLRRLTKNNIYLELTEKEIELIELLNKKNSTRKKDILSNIWKYSSDADTHTVETHIYRLRKKIKETFNDNNLIKSEKEGYTI